MGEGIGLQIHYPVRNHHVAQAKAIIKRIDTDGRQVLGQGDFAQAVALIECTPFDFSDRGRYSDRCQVRAIIKSMHADGRDIEIPGMVVYPLWNGHRAAITVIVIIFASHLEVTLIGINDIVIDAIHHKVIILLLDVREGLPIGSRLVGASTASRHRQRESAVVNRGIESVVINLRRSAGYTGDTG